LNISTFLAILNNDNTIDKPAISSLKSVITKFPYFQTARALYLKELKEQDSFKYNKTLKITAAYTRDRSILFDYITSKKFSNYTKPASTKENKILKVDKTKTVKTSNSKNTEDNLVDELAIGKPLSFTKAENHSFNQWLQLSNTKKPISRTIKPVKKEVEKEKIIEKFIQNNPKIEPLAKDKNITVAVAKNKQDAALMTETLAKVYLEQKKYENAMQAYRILSLKYPEKSGFFADQIKKIKKLQKHKS
jgi:hypothetical protein